MANEQGSTVAISEIQDMLGKLVWENLVLKSTLRQAQLALEALRENRLLVGDEPAETGGDSDPEV